MEGELRDSKRELGGPRGELLDSKVELLDLPVRTLNWASNHGLETLRELVAWRPEDFAKERNIGRRTVRETRELIESLLGCTWEAAWASVRGSVFAGAEAGEGADGEGDDEAVDSATETLTAGGAKGWARVAAFLSDAERAIPLRDVSLPTRMRNLVEREGMTTLGDLLGRSHEALMAQGNIGRKSLNDTLDAVRDHLSERASPPVFASFLESWQAQLGSFEPIPRMIVTRRAGMHGARETLEELGTMLGVSRERVRQIEAQVVDRLRQRSHWRKVLDAHLAAAFGSGRAVPLELLGQDPWWNGIERQEHLLGFVVRHILDGEITVLEAPSGKPYLIRFEEEEFEERLEAARLRVEKLEFPIEMSAIDAILRSEAAPLDPILFSELQLAVGERLLLDPERPGLALGVGRSRADEVIGFLGAQPEPVHVSVIEERFGRGAMPAEVLYFKRGVVGLRRHFPDLDAWMERLVPAAIEVMAERPAGRQWLVPEIHDALTERGLVPEWLGHWHLASLLRLSGRVEYLGRLRVATQGSGVEERLQYEQLLERLLREAGGPLPFHELLSLARVRTDISDGAATLLVGSAPFVRLDEERIGLVERDVPGGAPAVAAAVEAVTQHLKETERGLTPHLATRLVQGLSELHASWSRQLVTSLLRSEASVRIDRSKNIGLDAWDDARCPARAEFLRREVQKAGGRLAISELNTAMEAFYGRAPDRGSLGVLAQQVGVTLSGDELVRPVSIVPQAPPARVGISLAGIPAELREMFEDLVQQPLSDPAALREQVAQHQQIIEDEHHVNEFVDVEGARALARQCHALLDRWDDLAIPDRHVAHAAVCYFVSFEDVEHDLDIGGLDDDKQIMNAAWAYLGMQEEDHVAGAS